jgi:hypothetical protein
MKEDAVMNVLRLVVAALMFAGLPAVAAAQGDAGRVSIQAAVGTHANVAGNNQALSVGFSPGDRVTLLISAERLHLPTEVEQFEYGSSATRGGTTTFVSGEIQVVPVKFARVAPYVLAGVGAGRSRLNVNDLFPDPVTNNAALLFFGGGIRVPATSNLSVFADARFTLQLERESAGVFLFVPVRGGLAWRF